MYPMLIDFNNKKCVVIGAGKIAERRIKMLKNEGAEIKVIAPHDCPDSLKDISYVKKKYDKDDLKDAFIVVAATDDEELNAQIVHDAREKKILVSSVTKCEDSDILVPSAYKGNNITISVSTAGASPALSAELCREIGNNIKEYDNLCELHKKIREDLLSKGISKNKRHEIMKKISSYEMCKLYSACGEERFLKMTREFCYSNLEKTDIKKAILVVSFGTSYENTREKTIGAVENRIREAFKDFDVYRAFTSGVIVRKLRRNGIYIDTVPEALAKLSLMGYTEVYCQPTHIMPGEEYDDLCRDAERFVDTFSVLKIARPLLSQTVDYSQFIDAMYSDLKTDNNTAVVFMGHGTTHWANCVYPALQFWFEKRNFTNVFIGTVEGFPTLDDVLELLKRSSYDKIVLMPLMLVAGDHAQNDMAGDEEDSWYRILSNEGYSVQVRLKGLGEYEYIQDMYVKHLSEIII